MSSTILVSLFMKLFLLGPLLPEELGLQEIPQTQIVELTMSLSGKKPLISLKIKFVI